MNSAAILSRFEKINVWKKGDQRAPHKPLLILYALGQWQGGRSEVTFKEAEPELRKLLQRFGRPRKSDHPEQPFWRLQRNRVWAVQAPADIPRKTGDTIPTIDALRSPAVRGEFSPEVQTALTADKALITRIANLILERHFPESLHQEILDAVHLSTEAVTRKKRDAKFREKVLDAYQGCCAVCKFEVRVADVLVGLDAAHIRWHQFNGPATEQNGLALCVMHHKLFDFGAFTIREGRLRVSSKAKGAGFQEHLMKFHCQEVKKPIDPALHPTESNLAWHAREVFKGEELPCI
ncbi:hypothetical protein VT84_06365 [Gemmata sp. SH-PL17]|uniref:phosphorothioated DNA-binding restriction endonuclease n=1 Tax=Gemmata sp. SH-PL17 TaxID=1630693 RepID=UPI00078E515F|nr:HNH endonuclease [Gemmata sp. SH-PL17]AMV24000.1 hypothetical protein VT84_06365 [Gemmata sp. SH-PL17]